MSANPRNSLRYTALSFTTITYLIDKYLVGNKFIDSLPRMIVYPIVKYLLYFEYQVQYTWWSWMIDCHCKMGYKPISVI